MIEPAEFPWFRYSGYTFSLGLTDGTTAWLSGHSASEYDAGIGRIVVRGDMAAQAATAYAKIAAILASAGFGWGDVTRVVENVTVEGLDYYADAAAAREERVPGVPVVTQVVDRLLRRGALVEIEIGATRGGGRGLTPARSTAWFRTGVRESSDGLLFLPTILPVDEYGTVVSPGDPVGQYRWCLTRVERALAEVGLPLDRVAKIVETVPAIVGDDGSFRQLRRSLGAVATGRVTVGRLHLAGALVALDCVASRHEPVDVAPGLATGTGCAVVRAGRTVFLSHATGSRDDGDVLGQARGTYRWIAEGLRAAGLEARHLVKTIEYVVPDALADYRGVAGVRTEFLTAPWPASTGAVCTAAGPPGSLIVVDATAVAR